MFPDPASYKEAHPHQNNFLFHDTSDVDKSNVSTLQSNEMIIRIMKLKQKFT